MSKLDDILVTADRGHGWMFSEGATDENPDVLTAELKQAIKDLMLELIEQCTHELYVKKTKGTWTDGDELRQKVNEL